MKSPILPLIELGSLLVGLFVSLSIAWQRSYGANEVALSTWRRRALRLGLIGSSLSLALCLADLVRLQLITRGIAASKGGGWADTWGLTALFVVVMGSTICGAFGRGAARFLTVLSGILLGIVWYFLCLSTIP